MFITKFSMNSQNHTIIKNFDNIANYHDFIESAFPAEQMAGIRRRHLWRINRGNILLISENKPDLYELSKYATGIQVKNYQQLLDKLRNNQIYWFELTVNPYKQLKKQKLLSDKGLIKWLQARETRYGFKLGQAQIKFQNDLFVKSHHYHIHQVCMIGKLQILDVKKFKKLLTQGIGRNKAFGMGLMTVKLVNQRKQ